MLPRLSSLLYGLSLVSFMLSGGSAERRNMLERAKSNLEKRAAGQVASPRIEKRDHQDFRYLNNKTESE